MAKEKLLRIMDTLRRVPLEVWDTFVRNEPEWQFTTPVLERYGPNRFLTFMVMAGLNDFQLKGPAERSYWPPLVKYVEVHPVPSSPAELGEILKGFYWRERLPSTKLKRVDRFLRSPVAQELWEEDPSRIAREFKRFWYKIAVIMRQEKERKTVVFSSKCLGIGLLMLGVRDFDFTGIPVPVDSRVRELLRRWGLIGEASEREIQSLCEEVLAGIREVEPAVNMIHLDSFLWQMEGFYRRGDAFKPLVEMGMDPDLARAIEDLGR